MNLKRARYIMAICEAGGITAAAKKLFVSQPSLSQTVRLVEQELGVAVFEHGVTPPRLTYAGEKYLEAARAMMACEADLNNILEGIRHGERGQLRIGVSIQRGMQLLPMVLPTFARQFPEVRLLLEEKGSEFLERMVDDGEIDLALATTDPSNGRLEYILIENESFGLLTGRNNRLVSLYAPGEELELTAASGESFVALKPGHNIRGIQDRFFAHYSISPKVLLETDSVEAAIRITAACDCCMFCPHVFVRSNPALAGRGVYFRLKNEIHPRHFYACYSKKKYLPQYVHAFIALVQEATRRSNSSEIQGALGA